MAPSLTSSSTEVASADLPMLIGGAWQPAKQTYEVRDPYRGDIVAKAPRTSPADLDAALSAAVAAKSKAAAVPGYERAALLRRVGVLPEERAIAIAEVMTRESGKALKDARAEVIRSQDTIALSAEEAIRTGGVIINGSSTWRTDQLPYGGVKDSGIGREGPRYAIRDMTEERLVVFNA